MCVQPISSIFIDASRPPFTRVAFSRQHPLLLFAFHEDGSLSVWVKSAGDNYTLQGFHDLLRTNFHSKAVVPAALTVVQHPIDDLKFALANEDGRVYGSVCWFGRTRREVCVCGGGEGTARRALMTGCCFGMTDGFGRWR